jgi:curved DNA-binding protein CbpA
LIDFVGSSVLHLIDRHHPDKQSEVVDTTLFIRIQHAYQTLSNPASRAEYDVSLRQQQVIIDREIDLDDMRCETDQLLNIWYTFLTAVFSAIINPHYIYQNPFFHLSLLFNVVDRYCSECRCGSVFRIAEASLLSGSDIYQCQTCCLGVRVLFAEVE